MVNFSTWRSYFSNFRSNMLKCACCAMCIFSKISEVDNITFLLDLSPKPPSTMKKQPSMSFQTFKIDSVDVICSKINTLTDLTSAFWWNSSHPCQNACNEVVQLTIKLLNQFGQKISKYHDGTTKSGDQTIHKFKI